MNTKIKSLLCFFIFAIANYLMAQNKPISTEFFSPNKHYSIKIIKSRLHDSDRDDGTRTLVITIEGHPLLEIPTEGYILDAFWSPNGKYVAVNNRIANSGDYVWLFSLQDGKVLKKPYDSLPMDQETAKRPEFAEFEKYEIFREWIYVIGWNSMNQLNIRNSRLYRNINAYLSIDLTYTIEKNKLLLSEEKVTKKLRDDKSSTNN